MDNETNIPPVTTAPAPAAAASNVQQIISSAATGIALPPKKHTLKPVIVAVLVLAVLAGGYAASSHFGYGVSKQGVYTPTMVWKRFLESAPLPTYRNNFSFSYADLAKEQKTSNQLQTPNQLRAPGAEADDAVAKYLSNIELGVNGSGYNDLSDSAQPESESTTTYSFKAGGFNISSAFDYRLIGKDLYLHVGNNPLLGLLYGSAEAGDGEWTKVTLGDEKFGDVMFGGNRGRDSYLDFYKKASDPEYIKKFNDIWAKNKLLSDARFVGTETVHGTSTLHYTASVNKAGIKEALKKTFKEYFGSSKSAEQEQFGQYQTIFGGMIDKITVSGFDLWISPQNNQLYRVKLVSNAPSIMSLIEVLSVGARATSKDAKRLADVRQLASALELYFNDNEVYPATLSSLASDYIGIVPESPEPTGDCGPKTQGYFYTTTGPQQQGLDGVTGYADYTLYFCLGSTTGSYGAGMHVLSPSGIGDVSECPAVIGECKSSIGSLAAGNVPDQETIDAVAKINFSGQLVFDISYKDYGIITHLAPPSPLKSTDTNSNKSEKTPDTLANIRQLASALELYFNDNNKYPNSLTDLAPQYIGAIPAEIPATSPLCSGRTGLIYSMQSGGASYTLSFCLEQMTGGYGAGSRLLTPGGIQ